MGPKKAGVKKKKEGKVDDREAAARRNETELLALQLQLDMRSQEVRSRAGCRRARGGSRDGTLEVAGQACQGAGVSAVPPNSRPTPVGPEFPLLAGR